MSRYVISLGSNRPDGRRRLESAIDMLSGLMHDVTASDIYETMPEPPAPADAPRYHNAVLAGDYQGTMSQLDGVLTSLEVSAGKRMRRYDIPLDLDIVIADGKVIRESHFRTGYFNIGYRDLYCSTD